jgi:hypothetical protein
VAWLLLAAFSHENQQQNEEKKDLKNMQFGPGCCGSHLTFQLLGGYRNWLSPTYPRIKGVKVLTHLEYCFEKRAVGDLALGHLGKYSPRFSCLGTQRPV